VNLKARFKPRAEAGLLSRLVQEAWQDYQDRIANIDRQKEVAETIARYFEALIPAADFEVLSRYNCIAWHDKTSVRVYDSETEDIAKYREAFGVELPRKVPVFGSGGYGYPSGVACEPLDLREPNDPTKTRFTLPTELDPYFAELLKARKQYYREYKKSTRWPFEYSKEHGKYPTRNEIAEQFPVLSTWLRKQTEEPA
jgi:hypothetical protein